MQNPFEIIFLKDGTIVCLIDYYLQVEGWTPNSKKKIVWAYPDIIFGNYIIKESTLDVETKLGTDDIAKNVPHSCWFIIPYR